VTDTGGAEGAAKRRGYERGQNSYVRPEIPKDLVKATAAMGGPAIGTDADAASSSSAEPGAEDPLAALRFPYTGTYPRSAFDVDLAAQDSTVPWRQHRADLSNYFNYGFTEATWKVYAEKQLRIRADRGEGPQSVLPPPASGTGSSAGADAHISPAALVASIHAATPAVVPPKPVAPPVFAPRAIPPPVHGGTLAPYPVAQPTATMPGAPGVVPPPGQAPPSRFGPAAPAAHGMPHMPNQMQQMQQMQMQQLLYMQHMQMQNPNMPMHPQMQQQMQQMQQHIQANPVLMQQMQQMKQQMQANPQMMQQMQQMQMQQMQQMQQPQMQNPNFRNQQGPNQQGQGRSHESQGNSRKRPYQ
jgi:hypothetical protein